MIIFFYIVTGLAFVGVVVSLIAGGIAMQSQKDGATIRSNKWMQRRVFFQALAIIGLVITVYLQSRTG